MTINIREVEEKDLKSVFKLINELALFEKAPEEVTLTLEQLVKDFHANRFIAFAAENDTIIIGLALIYPVYSTWKGICYYLEDIIVSEKHRQKGIGSMLFETVIAYAKENKAARLRWQVLDWNTPAIKFYEKYNAIFENEWLTYKITY